MFKKLFLFSSVLFFLFCYCSLKETDICFTIENKNYLFESSTIRIKFDNQMRCIVFRKSGDSLLSIIRAAFVPNYIVINNNEVKYFEVNDEKVVVQNINNEFGRGKRAKITGTANGPFQSVIEKVLYIDIYEQFPEAALIQTEYKNINSTPGLVITKEINNRFKLDASLINKNYDRHAFWILQGGSYSSRPDWILPVKEDFSYQNYQGMKVVENKKKIKRLLGGGLPVLDVWCKETGFFIGSVREKATLVSLPAQVDDEGYLTIGIEYKRESIKFEQEIYQSIPTVIGVHNGDFYDGLRTYSNLMERKGLKMLENDPDDPVYEAIWCAWGFGPDFTIKHIYDMIPVLKEYNYKVVTIDDGWFNKNGDFKPRSNAFPNGDEDMRNFVKTFHDNGLKVKLWTTWCIAGPELQRQHPEWLVRDETGEIVYWEKSNKNIAYLCPGLEEVQNYFRELVQKFIGDWDYDGFKVDQQVINAMSNCYAVDHHHENPAESFESLSKIYQIISEETFKLKPDAIIEICPCGVFPSFYKMPYYNQSVSSDFNSQWQIRHRGKVLKALMGPESAFHGDHVERYYDESNFPSMIGVGGIPGSMFVSKPEDNADFLRAKYPGYLSPVRTEHFDKWLKVYREYKLSNGEYLNLYDIAYDKPETHVVKKDGILYYAFFAFKWDGEIEFRGLGKKNFIIFDYVNKKEIGKKTGNGKINVHFEKYLLVKAIPE